MSDFSVFHIKEATGEIVPKAIPHSRIRAVTLKEDGNTLHLKGEHKARQITDGGMQIAQSLGIIRQRAMVRLTPFKKTDGNAAYIPAELLASSSTFEYDGGRTKILTPDGQQLEVTESADTIGSVMQNFHVYFQQTEIPDKDILVF